MDTKRIAVIGIVGLPAKYGGFETFADYLSRYIHDKFDLTVYCSAKSYPEKIENYNNAKIEYIPLKATGIQSIPYDILSIVHAVRHNDILLVLGSSGAIVLPIISALFNKRIVFNMAGLEWKRSKWNWLARWFLKFSEKIAVKYSDVIVVDNKGLQDYIFETYNVESHVIAYGGDQVTRMEISKELKERFGFLHNPYSIAVARIQPDNNIDMILEAFVKLPKNPLVFVGNWDFSEYGKDLKKKYAQYNHIHLLDPIYDLSILDQLRSNCSYYIHGHSSGGTNPSLVEAMHLELPIFCFDVNFNRYTTENEAAYFNSSDELAEKIALMESNSEEKQRIGLRMKEIAERLYTWKYIVEEYERFF
ncbi:MAG: DUF1972 domain-containing protein [Sulfuricurvum sp.]|uniref:DUF1972 domain-containing protein n=1 Tax=Sulfuricurvum sp. TaxID=2025608 RepID=UPI0025CE3FEE|nr:DUF1972 domain-containing protein [Sulfuricurvum sp.]MCK9372287.1 DUF1972 domain-containing protein [Sulfuricurvum sp.]